MRFRGVVLSEVLCYISIVSVILIIIMSYTIMVNKMKSNKDFVVTEKSLFIQNSIYELEIDLFRSHDDLIVKNEKEKIVIYSKNTDRVYLTLTNDLMNFEFIERIIDVSSLSLEYKVYDKFILISNKEYNLIYVINLEGKK